MMTGDNVQAFKKVLISGKGNYVPTWRLSYYCSIIAILPQPVYSEHEA